MTEPIAIRLDGIAGGQVLSIKQGDVVVLMTDVRLNQDQRVSLVNDMAKALPNGLKVMVLDSGLKLAVLSPVQA